MASAQPEQSATHPVATGVVVGALAGAGGLVAVDAIRRLYLAAELRALLALRKAVTRVLRAPQGDTTARFDSRWRLDREALTVAAQAAAEAGPAIRQVVETARQAGADAAHHDLGLDDPPSVPSPVEADRLTAQVNIDHQRIAVAVQDEYRRIIDKAVAAEAGRINRQRVAQRALDEFATRGITVFRDKAGRAWSIDAYAEMAVRTAATTAQVDAYVARAAAAGHEFLQISHSATCCPKCLPYDGKVIAIADLPDAREAGLFHPNCKHTVRLVRPGPPITRPAPDPALYAAQQRLRYLERRVRAARRREAVALDPQALRKARAELRAAWAAIRDHVDQTGIVRQRQREQIIRAR